MYVDKELLFSDSQTVTTGSDTGVVSTNMLDLGTTNVDLGAGKNLYVVVVCKTAMNDSGSNSTLTAYLCHDDNSSGSSVTNFQTIGTFAALSAAGTVLAARVAPYVIPERYVGVQYIAANGALNAGAFTAFLTEDIERWKAYADNLTITG